MNTEAQRRAHAAYVERLKAGGGKSITLRVSKAAYEALQRLAVVHGSQAAAIEALLLAPTPSPAVVRSKPKAAATPSAPTAAPSVVPYAGDLPSRGAKPKIGKGKSK